MRDSVSNPQSSQTDSDHPSFDQDSRHFDQDSAQAESSIALEIHRREIHWTEAMKRAIRSQSVLRDHLGLPADPDASEAESFSTFVPLEFARRIRKDDPNDPLLRQVLASSEELNSPADFVSDPVGDLDSAAGGGLLHKYAGRALLVTQGACAIHCRYCFRKEFPYAQQGGRKERWQQALEYLSNDQSIDEVLLSGGDPLTMSDPALDELIGELESIPHLVRLRIHTRLPIAIPQRITQAFVERLRHSRLKIWTVIHANHANEIDEPVADSLVRLLDAGMPVLNQSVLLAGVNDSADALVSLSLRLINLGVQPYYLHQLDRVTGSSHFWVEVSKGKQIIQEMRERLPGYAVPRYVVERAGEKSKTPIA